MLNVENVKFCFILEDYCGGRLFI